MGLYYGESALPLPLSLALSFSLEDLFAQIEKFPRRFLP